MPLWEVTVMTAVPSLTPVTSPVSLTVAMLIIAAFPGEVLQVW